MIDGQEVIYLLSPRPLINLDSCLLNRSFGGKLLKSSRCFYECQRSTLKESLEAFSPISQFRFRSILNRRLSHSLIHEGTVFFCIAGLHRRRKELPLLVFLSSKDDPSGKMVGSQTKKIAAVSDFDKSKGSIE